MKRLLMALGLVLTAVTSMAQRTPVAIGTAMYFYNANELQIRLADSHRILTAPMGYINTSKRGEGLEILVGTHVRSCQDGQGELYISAMSSPEKLIARQPWFAAGAKTDTQKIATLICNDARKLGLY